MSRTEYFNLMRETSQEVNNDIEESLSAFQDDSSLENLLRELPDKRRAKPQLRPLLMRMAYQICGGEDWHTLVPALASAELNNTHLYLHNWIFDNKNQVWGGNLNQTRKRLNDLIISAQIFREMSEQSLERAFSSFDSSIQALVRDNFQKGIVLCYKGFKQDLDLTIDRFSEFSTDEEFIEIYKTKSENMRGNIYSSTSKLGAIFAEGTPEQIKALEDFGFYLGTGLHISNDLGDFALPSVDLEVFCKPYQDQLSDIKEGRLTLPIHYVLRNGSEDQKKALYDLAGNYNASYNQTKSAALAVIDSGAYDFCKSVSKEYYKKGKKVLHENFPSSKNRDMLSLMISSVRSNKFLVELKKLKA